MATIASNVNWGSGPTIGFDFSYESQRIGADMQYKITVSARPLTGDSHFGFPIYLEIKLDGVVKLSAYTFKPASPNQWTVARSYTTDWLPVTGKTSGSTILAIRLYSGSGSSRNATYTYSLPIIAAASTFTTSATKTLGTAITVTINKSLSSYTHTITYSCGNASDTIVSKTASASVSWTPPISLASQAPNSEYANITLTLETYNGSILVGKESQAASYYIPASIIPNISTLSATPVNAVWNKYIQGHSSVSINVTAASVYGASIRTYQISASEGDQNYYGSDKSWTSGVLNSTGQLTFTVIVTDTRQRTASKTVSITVEAYTKPVISITPPERTNSAGVKDINGTYTAIQASATYSSVGGSNSLTMTYAYRLQGAGAWSGAASLTPGRRTVIGGSFSVSNTYEIQIAAKDGISSVEQIVILPPALLQFALGKDRFGLMGYPEGPGGWIFSDVTIRGQLKVEGKTAKAVSGDYIKYSASGRGFTMYRVSGSQNIEISALKAMTTIGYNGRQYTLSDTDNENLNWRPYARWFGSCGNYDIIIIWDTSMYNSSWTGTAKTVGIFIASSTGTVTYGNINTIATAPEQKIQTIVGVYPGSGASENLPTIYEDAVDGTVFAVGTGIADTARATGFRVSANGRVYYGAASASGADTAECYEWEDGNPNGEDRRGRIVTLDGEKIRFAGENDKYILGIISAYPGIIGDAYEDVWQGKYLKDVFGAPLVKTVNVPETVKRDEEDNISVVPAHVERNLVISPEYDPYVPYVPRSKRKEWAYVGRLGKLVVVDDGTCVVNGYCRPLADGIGTASREITSLRVMSRIDESHIRVTL